MADPVYMRLARNKLVATIVVIALGAWLLWPDSADGAWAWLQAGSADWKIKFAFIGWCVLSLAMIYDTLTGFIKAFKSVAPTMPRSKR